MADLAHTITPKSDQLNSDDLIAGPMTIRITKVAVKGDGAEQPVAVHFEGDDGKPWKPCKSMIRVMVHAWGANSAIYAGRSLTLYRDPAVTWGGMAIGGIRISHMSHVNGALTMALTATRGSRKQFTVKPLASGPSPLPDPDSPTAIPLDAHADADAMKRWAKHLRDQITRAASPGLKITWTELNADALLRIGAHSPKLAAWIREALPLDADTKSSAPALGADNPAGRNPPLADRLAGAGALDAIEDWRDAP